MPDHGRRGRARPGHLGELTRYLPFELADDVLASTKTVQKRVRALPSRVGVYFVLALALFPGRLARSGVTWGRWSLVWSCFAGRLTQGRYGPGIRNH